jgi:hypothetical protein
MKMMVAKEQKEQYKYRQEAMNNEDVFEDTTHATKFKYVKKYYTVSDDI